MKGGEGVGRQKEDGKCGETKVREEGRGSEEGKVGQREGRR